MAARWQFFEGFVPFQRNVHYRCARARRRKPFLSAVRKCTSRRHLFTSRALIDESYSTEPSRSLNVCQMLWIMSACCVWNCLMSTASWWRMNLRRAYNNLVIGLSPAQKSSQFENHMRGGGLAFGNTACVGFPAMGGCCLDTSRFICFAVACSACAFYGKTEEAITQVGGISLYVLVVCSSVKNKQQPLLRPVEKNPKLLPNLLKITPQLGGID